MLYEDDKPAEPVFYNTDGHYERGYDTWRDQGEVRVRVPAIDGKDTEDRSKSDFLTKVIAISQTLWFTTQFTTRLVQKLALTELEVLTLAFVGFNIAKWLSSTTFFHSTQNSQVASETSGNRC